MLSTKRQLGPRTDRRPGVVLLMVLVVVVLLTLAAFQYSDLMVAEYQAADNYHKLTQAKAFADSGVHYAAAALSTPDNIENMLGGNPFDNEESFRNRSVVGEETKKTPGMFTLAAPASGESGESALRFGVTDESGKINLNAMMKRDPSGRQLYDM